MWVGTLSFWLLYRQPDTGERLGVDQALYGTFSLVFFQPSLRFPRQPWLEVLYFVVPVVGLGVLADGVLRFGVMLFNKRARKEEWQVALASTYRDHVIVCGLGKLGYRVVLQLLEFGEEVVGVENVADRPFVSILRGMNVPVVVSTRASAMRSYRPGCAMLRRSSPLDDLTNLDIALTHELQPLKSRS
jgi:hypothetical protein